MPQLAIAVVAIAAGYAGATAVGFAVGTLAFAVASTVIAGVVTYGLSAAYNAIAGSSNASKSSTTSGAADRKQLIRSSDASRVVVYGQARVSGPLVYAASSGPDQQYLHLVVPLASHQIAGVDTIWINETAIPAAYLDAEGEVTQGELAGFARIRRHLGDQTAADPALVAESPDGWSADHKLLGVAYLYIRLTFSRDLFPSGLQTISAQIRGKLVLDPRTGLTVFSTNWALNVLDYLVSEDGLACQADELDAASFIAAANLSDELVQLDPAGTQFQPRYSCDGAFSLDEKPIDIIEGMIGAGCGALTYVQGRYQLHGGAYEVPTATLTTADFLDELELITKPQRGDLFNAVRGTFIDPSREWQSSEYPAFTDAMFEAEDGERIWRDVEFKWTIDPTRCQRLAKQLLRRHRESLSFTVSVRYSAMRFTVWQSVAVTVAELGWAAKVFRLVTWSFDPPTGAIKLTFNEDGAGSYGWLYDEAASIPPSPDTTLISPTKLPVPTNLLLVPSTAMEADGTAVPAMDLRWSAAKHAFVQAHEVQWRVVGALTWYSNDVALPATSFLLRPVLTGQAIEARVRAIAALVRGPWSAIGNGTGEPDITPPGIAYIHSVVGLVRGLSVGWTNPAAPDLAHVEVWESGAFDGPYGKVAEVRGTHFVRVGLPPAQVAYYRTRAVDRSGNAGQFSPTASGRASLLVASDIQDGILNTAKFAAGLTVPEVVDQLPGAGNFEGRLAFLTSNGKLYRFSGGQWTASVPAVDVGPGLTSDQIASIAAAKMTGQIVGTQIADGSISTPKILAGQVVAGHIGANQIIGAHIAADQIAAQHILAGNILTGHLGANSVTAGKIAADAVTAGTIQAGAVAADQIAGNQVRARHLAVEETLITTSAQMGTAVIQEAQIGALTVDTIKIKAGAVSNMWVEQWTGTHEGAEAQLLAFAAGDAVYGARWFVQVHVAGLGNPYSVESGAPGSDNYSSIVQVPGGTVRLYCDGALYRQAALGYPNTTLIWGGVLGAGQRTFSVRAATTQGGQVKEIIVVAQMMKR